jgi:hypothetical protein
LLISKDPVLLEEKAPDEDDGKKPTLQEVLVRETARIGEQAEKQAVVFSGFVEKAATQATNGEFERAVQKAGKQVEKFFKKKW